MRTLEKKKYPLLIMEAFIDRCEKLPPTHVLDTKYKSPVPKLDEDFIIKTFFEGSEGRKEPLLLSALIACIEDFMSLGDKCTEQPPAQSQMFQNSTDFLRRATNEMLKSKTLEW